MADIDPRPAPRRIALGDELQFELGAMRVLPSELAVEVDGQRRELQPRVLRVLIALARARPSVVSREKLIEQCWDGRIVGDDAINRCILSLRHLADEFTPAPFVIDTVPRVGHRLIERGGSPADLRPARRHARPWLWPVSAANIAVLILIAVVAGRRWWSEPPPDPPTILVTAGEDDGASRSLAQDLVTKLGSLEKAQSVSTRLIGGAAKPSDKPDLILEVGRVADAGMVGASLVLTAAPERTILWSRQFDQASRKLADLQQQVAFAAAPLVRCAGEAMESRERLTEPDLKTYLDACTGPPDVEVDPQKAVATLEGIVGRAPRFVGGWSELLAAETEQLVNASGAERIAVSKTLARHVAAARRLEPNLPESFIAESMLAPPVQLAERERILETAVARNPDHAQARAQRAIFLQSVGRINEALIDARQAVELDPAALGIRDIYIATLATAGRVDAARAELGAAERLWPGSSYLKLARYRLNLRWGDPRQALAMLRSGAVNSPGARMQEPFLKARIDRSRQHVQYAIEFGRNVFKVHPEAIDSYAQTLAEFDCTDELLDVLQNWRRTDLLDSVTGVLFRPAFADVHRSPRFMQAANRLGLLKYWRTTNQWPSFCFAPDLPYDCKAEAARVAGTNA